MSDYLTDETTGMDYVEFNGVRRYLAKLPYKPLMGSSEFGDKIGLVPRNRWKNVNRRSKFQAWTLDQGQRNSCVGNGAALGLRQSRALDGKTDVPLSPGFLYSLINNNRDQGAFISDALKALIDVGTCSFSTVGQSPIFKRDMPAAATREAARFRLGEAYHAKTFDEIMSGIQLGFVAVYGIMVGQKFTEFDRYGVAGYTRGPGNHCMMAAGGVKLPDGRWVLDNQNSWGMRFGEMGFCYLDEKHFDGIDPDCFLIRCAHEDPEEDATIPAVQ